MKAFTRGCVRAGRSLLCVLSVSCLAEASPAKNKGDLVVMKNGDRLTGEIKQLVHGLLSFKASYMNASVELDWNEVATLQTRDPFITTLVSGWRVTGPIERTTRKQGGREEFVLGAGSTGLVVHPAQVIEMRQAEESVWKQVNGNVDFGLSYTSGTNPTTLSLSVQDPGRPGTA
jgi:hypothetical protein